MDPYGRWRQAVWVTGVAIIMLLTGVILLVMMIVFFAALGPGLAPAPPGY